MRKYIIPAAVLAIVLIIAVAILTTHMGSGVKASPASSTSPGIGQPAITHNASAAASTVCGTTMTTSDVQTYLAAHLIPQGMSVTSGTPTVASIDLQNVTTGSINADALVTSTAACGTTGVQKVYVVTLNGNFRLNGMPMPSTAKVPTGTTATEVFDAQTGNLLEESAS